MSQNRSCTQHEDCKIDERGQHWQSDPFGPKGVRYRLILSYKRDENGAMTDLWANDIWAAGRVIGAEFKGN